MSMPETTAAPRKPSVAEDFNAVSSAFAGTVDDPHPLYKELRRTSPVMRGDLLARFGMWSQAGVETPERPIYTLFKYDDVMAVLRDPQTYTSGLIGEHVGTFLGRFLLTAMDGEQHKLMRALLAPVFAPSVVRDMRENTVEPLAQREYIDVLKPRKRADLLADIMLPYPIRAIYQIIGFENDPEMIETFAAWALRILAGPGKDPAKAEESMRAAFKAAQDLYDHLVIIVSERRAQGSEGKDLIGYLLRASYEGRSLDNAEIAEILRQLLPAAAETTTRSFGSMLVHLLRDPDLLDQVREDRSLIGRVINEGMRIDPAPQFLARRCARDVEIRGVKIPKGAALSLATSSANRDEDYFPDGDSFDLSRAERPSFGFGFGAHLCMGMAMAKMEMDVMLNAMLDGFPGLRLDPDAPPPVIRGMQLRGPDSIPVVWD